LVVSTNGTSTNSTPSFTLGATTEVDAIGFLMWARGGTGGALFAYIASNGVEVAGTRVMVPLITLPNMIYSPEGYGWICIKMPSPVTLAAGTYTVMFYNTESQMSMAFNNSLSGNPPCYFVRTTEQAAPGGGDTIIIGGEYGVFDVTSSLQSSDDFSGTLSNWTAVGGGSQSQTIVSGELNYVITGGTGDPTKYVMTGGYSGTDMMVKAKIKINSLSNSSNARAGISVRSTASGQGALALIFRGDLANQLVFLEEGIQFSAQWNFTWTTGTYYYLKLAVVGARCYGKAWAAAGSEPAHWQFFFSHTNTRTSGFAAITGPVNGTSSNITVDEFEVSSISGVTGGISTRTITVDTDSVSPITFGNFFVGNGAVLKHPTTQNSQLRLATNGGNFSGLLFPMVINNGGRYEIGSTTTPIPSAYTAIFECVGHANTDIGIVVWEGGTFLAHGANDRTIRTTLTGTTNAGSSTLTHNTVSGWATGDVIGVCSTSRNNYAGSGTNQNEQRVISTPGATSTVVSSAFTYQHEGGFSPTGSGFTFGAMVINLTRNVRIQGTTTTSTMAIYYGPAATLDVRYAQHRNWGGGDDPRRGYYIEGNTINTFRVQGCSFYDLRANQSAMVFYHRGSTGYVSCIDNVAYGTGANIDHFYFMGINLPAQNDVILTGNCCINFSGNQFRLLDANVVCDDNWIGGCAAGFEIYSNNGNGLRSFQNNRSYTCNYFIYTNSYVGFVNQGGRAWRTREVSLWHDAFGIHIVTKPNSNGRFAWEHVDYIAAGCSNVGATATIYLRSSGHLIVRDSKVYSDPSATVNYAWANGSTHRGTTELINTVMGVTGYAFSSILAMRDNGDAKVIIDDCPISFTSSFIVDQYLLPYPQQTGVGIINYNAINGDNRTYKGQGTIQTDTTIYRTSAPSLRMTPLGDSRNTHRLTTEGLVGPFIVQCPAGQFKTINVYIRKSVSGDGAAYNGLAPRLMLYPNYAGGGVSGLTVLATSVGAAGSWELLTGVTPSAIIDTTFEFYIDCTGSAGWVNVDDISIS
jgi:hypothetical protein